MLGDALIYNIIANKKHMSYVCGAPPLFRETLWGGDINKFSARRKVLFGAGGHQKPATE